MTVSGFTAVPAFFLLHFSNGMFKYKKVKRLKIKYSFDYNFYGSAPLSHMTAAALANI